MDGDIDVAVVGARAGAATATFPRDKTGGDGIAAHEFDLLGALAVPGLLDLAVDVPLVRIRTLPAA
jgi:hypothetical protein